MVTRLNVTRNSFVTLTYIQGFENIADMVMKITLTVPVVGCPIKNPHTLILVKNCVPLKFHPVFILTAHHFL